MEVSEDIQYDHFSMDDDKSPFQLELNREALEAAL